TQKKVAGCLGISKSALSNYEKSIHHPPYGVLVKLGDLYGVSADYLLGRTPCRLGIAILNRELPYGYTLGDCIEVILAADQEHLAHLLRYFELILPGFQEKNGEKACP
ncbi:MAG: helix-turn-helix transcriptional regulator, partial [Clostridium sp.]|nr:helix-turn-helix transcriptional regulator [Clostridium sp.]